MSPRTSSRMRRALSIFATAALVATGAMVTAGPAQAASLGAVTFTGSSIVVEGDLGDTFSFNNTSGSAVTLRNGTGSVGASCNSPGCGVTNMGSITLTVTAYGTVDIVGPSRTLTLVAPTGDSSDSGQVPPPVVQQFGKPASGTCDSAAPAALNWSGVASGGWGESWAQWINSGRGGAVCTRTLVYSTAQGRWIVG